MPRSIDDRRADAARFDFRRIHEHLRFGTASDRYAAWIDQIYPRDVWAGEVKTRKKRSGAETFEERMLPIASVEDYFLHFSVLELDFTFYRPLVEADGKPSNTLFTLQQYADYAPANARFLLKAPQAFSARTLRQRVDGRTQYVDNPDYLDAQAYTDRFLVPALGALGPRMVGVLFEQEYARRSESPSPDGFIGELDGFFQDVPDSVPTHLEIRSAHLLTPAYFAWLESRGLGFVFSHWTWLPSLKEQWLLTGERFTEASGEAVVRLLNPRDMRYGEAFALAYPFEGPAPGLADTPQARQMIDEVTALAYKAIWKGINLNVIANNRAWGNSPDLARTVTNRFLDFASRYDV